MNETELLGEVLRGEDLTIFDYRDSELEELNDDCAKNSNTAESEEEEEEGAVVETSEEAESDESADSSGEEESDNADEDSDDDKDSEWVDEYNGCGGCHGAGGCRENVDVNAYAVYPEVEVEMMKPYLKLCLCCRDNFDKYKAQSDDVSPDNLNFLLRKPGSTPRRPLCYAAIGGQAEVGAHLLTSQSFEEQIVSALFTPNDDWHDNPMFIAIRLGHISFVRMLLQHGWTPEVDGNKLCINSIEQAARCGQLEILRLLLDGEATDDDQITTKRSGLWAPLLQPSDDPRLGPSAHLIHRAKLLFSAMCRPKNKAVIDYLVSEWSIDPALVTYSLDAQEMVRYRGFIMGRAAQIDQKSYTHTLKIPANRVRGSNNEILKFVASRKGVSALATKCTPLSNPYHVLADKITCSPTHEKDEDEEDEDEDEEDEDEDEDEDEEDEDEEDEDEEDEDDTTDNADSDTKESCDNERESKKSTSSGSNDNASDSSPSSQEIDDVATAAMARGGWDGTWSAEFGFSALCDRSEGCFELTPKEQEDTQEDASVAHDCPKNFCTAVFGYRAFLRAAQTGDLDKIKAMWAAQEVVTGDNIDLLAGPDKKAKGRALSFAVFGGHMDVAEYLLTTCESTLFIPSEMHHNPMFAAIHKGNISAVRFLLKQGWSPDVEGNVVCTTSLEYAAQCGQLDIVKLFLIKSDGASDDAQTGLWAQLIHPPFPNVEEKDEKARYPSYRAMPRHGPQESRRRLLQACVRCPGNLQMLKFFLEEVGLHVKEEDDQSQLLVQAAMQPSSLETVKYLCEVANVSVNNPTSAANVLFAAASSANNFELIQYLIGALQPLEIEGQATAKILNQVVKHDANKQTFEFLINVAGWDINCPTMTLFDRSEPHVLEYLLNHVSKLNVSAILDSRGRSPLHMLVRGLKASGINGIRMIEALLANGADPSARDAMGVTPLHLTNSATVARILCDFGADTLATDRLGVSVLAYGSDEVSDRKTRAKGLMAKAAEGGPMLVAMRDHNDGATAVLKYAEHDSLSLYKATLGLSGDAFKATPIPPVPRLRPEEVDSHGKTILHYATITFPPHNHKSELVPYLISNKKCLPTDVDDKGQSALHYGCNNYRDALAAGGWSPNLKDKDGRTPLDICWGEMPGLCFFTGALAAFSGLPEAISKKYNYTSKLVKKGAAEEIVAALVKAEEERESSGCMCVPIDTTLAVAYTDEVADYGGDVDVIDEGMCIFALMDVRARIVHNARSKKSRCEVATNKKGQPLKRKKASISPPPLFTKIKNSDGLTLVDVYKKEAYYTWPKNIPSFFKEALAIIDSLN